MINITGPDDILDPATKRAAFAGALFLDRDGVINVDKGYVYRRADFEFVDGIDTLIQAARQASWAIIVVTNQSGIGRGYYSEKDFKAITHYMADELSAIDAPIDHVFFAPHHEDAISASYRVPDHAWRKPNPGMLHAAMSHYNLRPEACLMIGDKVTDMQAAYSAGIERRCLFSPQSDNCDDAVFYLRDLRAAISLFDSK